MSITPRRGLAAALVLASWSVLACTDFEAPEPIVLPDVIVADPSFERDIQPIFTARCATASCHNLGTQQQGLNLQAGFAYDAIVGHVTPTSHELALIDPGDADNSWLVRMIQADPARRFQVERMPLGREPLTDNQIATIVNWVNRGAARN
jgi:hypothetical protein